MGSDRLYNFDVNIESATLPTAGTPSGNDDLITKSYGDTHYGGGGGGGSLLWIEDVDSPLSILENFLRVYQYQSGLSQNLYCLVGVPNNYSAGNPIKMRMPFYSPDSSGTALMSIQTTLIRTGTDAMSSTTNQRTSTNSAVTLGAGTVNKPQGVVFDLSSSSGQINSVAISAGDLIIVRLFRGSDSATSDLKVAVNAAGVTFS